MILHEIAAQIVVDQNNINNKDNKESKDDTNSDKNIQEWHKIK